MRSMCLRPVVLGSAVLSAALVAVPVSAAAAPAPTAPVIRLVAATTHVTYERFSPDEPVFFLQLGAHAMAGATPFEIRASRASYQDPVVAQLVTRHGNRETLTRLPAGLVSGLTGLTDFLHVRVTDAGGTALLDRNTTFCPNSYWGCGRVRTPRTRRRIRSSAPAWRSPSAPYGACRPAGAPS
jgi:hypothetical protein